MLLRLQFELVPDDPIPQCTAVHQTLVEGDATLSNEEEMARSSRTNRFEGGHNPRQYQATGTVPVTKIQTIVAGIAPTTVEEISGTDAFRIVLVGIMLAIVLIEMTNAIVRRAVPV
ncbi:unnamed protein product [Strongylus vulgaris]|uniref:Uncharacterized protein n=1 Tax=Strongylus vulgaris TaxID=40348 RepID=A0A3P7IQW0_STRVU|nr:unnamed protein product [Strongylus vulgaris]